METPTGLRHRSFSGHENNDGQRLFEWFLGELGAQREAIDLAEKRWATETFRSYRRSLQNFSEYLTRKGVPWEDLLEKRKALAEVSNFLAWAEQNGQWSRSTLRVMKGQLKQVFRMSPGSGGEELLDLVGRGLDRSAPQPKRHYDDMWEIDDLVNFMREQPANERLPDAELQTKAMVLLMIFSACRLSEIARVTAPAVQEEKGCFTATTIMKQKQAMIQPLRVYTLSDGAVCPVRALNAWDERRKRLHPPPYFFFNLTTRHHLRQSDVSAAFRGLMTQAGIPERFGGYSIKHAVITKLFRTGTPDEQIVSFGRWKPGSTVPRTYYYIASNKPQWLGSQILAPAPWPTARNRVFEKDASPQSSEPRTPDAATPQGGAELVTVEGD
jgi:site-specific recombinase XerD